MQYAPHCLHIKITSSKALTVGKLCLRSISDAYAYIRNAKECGKYMIIKSPAERASELIRSNESQRIHKIYLIL